MRPAAEALWSAGEKNCGCNVKEHESKTIDVACEACNCTFNENKKCSADHIGIAGDRKSVV